MTRRCRSSEFQPISGFQRPRCQPIRYPQGQKRHLTGLTLSADPVLSLHRVSAPVIRSLRGNRIGARREGRAIQNLHGSPHGTRRASRAIRSLRGSPHPHGTHRARHVIQSLHGNRVIRSPPESPGRLPIAPSKATRPAGQPIDLASPAATKLLCSPAAGRGVLVLSQRTGRRRSRSRRLLQL